MLKGKTLIELAQEVTRQQESKRDYVATDNGWHMDLYGDSPVTVKAAIGSQGQYGISPIAHGQVSTRLGIPKAYYDTMLSQAPGLLRDNVNHWLGKSNKKRMLRTLDGKLRAVLSDRYRALDNSDCLEAILPVFNDERLEIRACDVTERRMYVQALSPRLKGDVKVGDAVQGGITIGNSEVGLGRLDVSLFVMRLVCLNGMVTQSSFRQVHVGRSTAKGMDLTDAQEFFSDSTRRLDDAAFFKKMQDVVRGILSEDHFGAMLETLQGAAERKIEGDPVKSVEVLANRLALTEGEQGGVLRHLIEGGDLSAWGLANAVTRLAHDAEDFDRNVELQRAGNQVIELPRTDWEAVASAA
jgi:hypothetical protein